MTLALIGNQNCGKTTLFNQLTGSNQHVGNFPGVTVEGKSGLIRGQKNVEVVDLPGIYSLSPYTNEEIVTRDFITQHKPQGIINIVDATNIERNLYLSLQLLELGIPIVIALNMMDELRSNKGSVHIVKMEELLGVPVVPISASKNEGVDELIQIAVKTAEGNICPMRRDFCAGPVHRTLHAVAHLIEDHAEQIGIPSIFVATKLIEGDDPLLESLHLSENEVDILDHSVREMEGELDTDRKAAIADMRYQFIESLCKTAVVKPQVSKQHLRSVKIDELLTHKYMAIPVFLGIMGLIFWVTFGVIGSFFSDLFSGGIDLLSAVVSHALLDYGINPVVHSLIIDGVFAGVGSVLSFIPTIVILFFFLSMLEDSGYMARVAFVMDKPLRKLGLSGKSFVPMLIGLGCTVPAVMAARTLPGERDRKMTIMLTPFISCSAKLPIYGMFTMAFFPYGRAGIIMVLYLTGILVGILSALVFKRTRYRGKPVPFVMELPNYRLPNLKSVLLLMWDKAKDFLTRAFTVIFAASIIIWFLQTFDSHLNVVEDSAQSLLADVGKFLAPVFAPLGFADWKAATALITGFSAKETIISTFAVLTGAGTAELPTALNTLFTPLTAFVFLTFTLIYTPCVAAVAAIKRELGSAWSALGVVLYQTGIAWVVAFIVYRIGLLFL